MSANSYLWTITQMDCLPEFEGQVDYVIAAHWTVLGSDGAGHSGSVYSVQNFVPNQSVSDYIPFDQLTEEQVIEWVQVVMGPAQVQAIYTSIDSQIEDEINPKVVSPPNPWSSVENNHQG